MKKYLYMLAACLAALMVSACQNPRYDVREGSFGPQNVRDTNVPGTQIRYNNVAILDTSIAEKVFTEATNSRRTPTGTLEVWAVLRNRTDYPLQLECRASFYDKSTAPVEGPTAWKRLMLAPNSTNHYKEFSTTTDIGYYTIEVREGR